MQGRIENGFTLVELLVSLFLFGMLAAAGVSLLSFSVRAQEVAEGRLEELSRFRRMATLMAGDLGQSAARVHRDEAGAVQPAFAGASGEAQGTALAFVRRGWENVEGEPRASLQKVEYRLEGARIERRAYPLVDGAAPMAAMILAEGVTGLRLRYRDGEGQWRDRWDPAGPADLPRAVELVVEAKGSAPTRQLFLTGRGW
jgi:general secretion pathway protein J